MLKFYISDKPEVDFDLSRRHFGITHSSRVNCVHLLKEVSEFFSRSSGTAIHY